MRYIATAESAPFPASAPEPVPASPYKGRTIATLRDGVYSSTYPNGDVIPS